MAFIAIDYDQTLGDFEGVLAPMIEAAKGRGLTPIIVTARSNEHLDFHTNDLIPHAKKLNLGIVFCAWKSKRVICQYFGIYPHIWVDDSPEAIVSCKFLNYSIIDELFDEGKVAYYTAQEVQDGL